MIFLKKKFPNDEVGNKLAEYFENKLNFKIKHHVYFYLNLKDQENTKLTELLQSRGFEGKIIYENNFPFFVFKKHMILDYEEINNIIKMIEKMTNLKIMKWEVKE